VKIELRTDDAVLENSSHIKRDPQKEKDLLYHTPFARWLHQTGLGLD